MESNVTFKAGLVGAGYISDYHIFALGRLSHVEIVGVFDVDTVKTKALAEKYGIAACGSMKELREKGANVIHVLTPPHTHASVTIAALEMGCHVLVEKPLAVDERDCVKIQAKADELGLQVCVNHSLLFDPQVHAALDAVKRGKLGKIVSVDILRSSIYPPFEGGALPPQYRNAGYPYRDLGVHCLYLMEALLGPIEHVSGEWQSLGGEPNLMYDEWRSVVKCRDGMGQFQLSWNTRPLQNQIIIQGTKGFMQVDLFLMFHALRSSGPLPKPAERIINAMTNAKAISWQVPLNVLKFIMKKVRPYHGLQDLVAAFYVSLAEKTPVPVSVDDAQRVVKWTEVVACAADADYAKRLATIPALKGADVLVTGASGALGSAVVDRLVKEGRRVRVMVRRMPEVVPPGVEVALGNLGCPDDVERAVRGVKTVIHCGAAMKGGWLDHLGATVVGTKNVLESCKKNGIKKLVHISSMSVIQWAGARKNAVVDENTPLESRAEVRGAYTRAKMEAEKLVVAFCKENALPCVILRPGQIYGGRIPLLTGAVARKVGKRWLILGNGKVNLPLVKMDDVVEGIMLAHDGALEKREIIQLTDDDCPTQLEVLKREFKGKAKVIRVPRMVVFTMGKFSEFAFALLKRPSPLAAYRMRSALARRTFSNARAKELLGWKPGCGARAVHSPRRHGDTEETKKDEREMAGVA